MLRHHTTQKLKSIGRDEFNHLIYIITHPHVSVQTPLIGEAQQVKYLIEMGGELMESGFELRTSALIPC
jgi:hypothetical protein